MLPTLGGAARHIFCDTKVTRDPASGLRPFHDQTIWNTIWNTMWNTMRYHEHVWAWADPRSYGDQVRLIRVNGSLHTMRPNLPKFPWTSLQMGGTCVSWAVCLRCLSWCSPAAHGDARSQLVVACAPPAADLAGPIRSSQPGTSQHRSVATSDIIKCTRQKICGYYVDIMWINLDPSVDLWSINYTCMYPIWINHVIYHRMAMLTFYYHIYFFKARGGYASCVNVKQARASLTVLLSSSCSKAKSIRTCISSSSKGSTLIFSKFLATRPSVNSWMYQVSV